MLLLEIRELAVADAVLAGARAAARECVLRRPRRSALPPARSTRVVRVEQESRRGSCRRRRGRRCRREDPIRRARAARARSRRRAPTPGRRRRSSSPSTRARWAMDAMSELCRALHICARAVGSLSDSNAVAPSSSATSRVVTRSPATPASEPPNSTKRYGDSGKLVPENALSAAIVVASRSSQRVTGTPTPISVAAARHAASTEGNAARATTMWSGIGCSRSVSSVITPSVPSDPMKRFVRL